MRKTLMALGIAVLSARSGEAGYVNYGDSALDACRNASLVAVGTVAASHELVSYTADCGRVFVNGVVVAIQTSLWGTATGQVVVLVSEAKTTAPMEHNVPSPRIGDCYLLFLSQIRNETGVVDAPCYVGATALHGASWVRMNSQPKEAGYEEMRLALNACCDLTEYLRVEGEPIRQRVPSAEEQRNIRLFKALSDFIVSGPTSRNIRSVREALIVLKQTDRNSIASRLADTPTTGKNLGEKEAVR